MSSIASENSKIHNLWIEVPEPRRCHQIEKLVTLGKAGCQFVALTKTGTVISNAVSPNAHYPLGCCKWAVTDALATLGVISKKEAQEHKQRERAYVETRDRFQSLNAVIAKMRKLGFPVDATKLRKIREEINNPKA